VLVKGIDIGAARLNIVKDPDNIMRKAFSFSSESGGLLMR
jgi:hypothetical protein